MVYDPATTGFKDDAGFLILLLLLVSFIFYT